MSNKKVKIDTANEVDETAEELLTVEEVKDTPFTLVKHDNEYFLALGKYRLTEPSTDKDEILASVNDTSWERLLALMHAVATEVVLNSQKDGK